MTATIDRPVVAPVATKRNRLLTIVAIIALAVGIGSFAGGVFGAAYTYNMAAVENVTTPDDARIPEAAVRGPFTMWAQADIITYHQLDRTDGLRYAEMPRTVDQVDEAGNVVLDETGAPVQVPNDTRLSWIDATALTSALNLGIIAYAFSAFAMVVGVAMTGFGLVFLSLREKTAA
jgi:hypothetical protein